MHNLANYIDNGSSAEEETPVRPKVKVEDLKDGATFVIVFYEGSYFPGRVMKVKKTGVEVSCMTRSNRKVWKWPERPDLHEYVL